MQPRRQYLSAHHHGAGPGVLHELEVRAAVDVDDERWHTGGRDLPGAFGRREHEAVQLSAIGRMDRHELRRLEGERRHPRVDFGVE